MEEERRLCYVGMTRAETKLYLSWARYRRRFGGGQPEPSIPSRFLKEVPRDAGRRACAATRGHVDLYAERYEVRETARRNLYTGKTYNSVDNIRQFFTERGMPAPQGLRRAAAAGSGSAEPPAAGSAVEYAGAEEKIGARLDGGARQVGPRHGAAPGRFGRRYQGHGEFSRIRVEETNREIRRNQG